MAGIKEQMGCLLKPDLLSDVQILSWKQNQPCPVACGFPSPHSPPPPVSNESCFSHFCISCLVKDSEKNHWPIRCLRVRSWTQSSLSMNAAAHHTGTGWADFAHGFWRDFFYSVASPPHLFITLPVSNYCPLGGLEQAPNKSTVGQNIENETPVPMVTDGNMMQFSLVGTFFLFVSALQGAAWCRFDMLIYLVNRRNHYAY